MAMLGMPATAYLLRCDRVGQLQNRKPRNPENWRKMAENQENWRKIGPKYDFSLLPLFPIPRLGAFLHSVAGRCGRNSCAHPPPKYVCLVNERRKRGHSF